MRAPGDKFGCLRDKTKQIVANSIEECYNILMGKTMRKPNHRSWSDSDSQAFRDGNRLRASTIQGKRKPAPSVEEWGDLEDWLDD